MSTCTLDTINNIKKCIMTFSNSIWPGNQSAGFFILGILLLIIGGFILYLSPRNEFKKYAKITLTFCFLFLVFVFIINSLYDCNLDTIQTTGKCIKTFGENVIPKNYIIGDESNYIMGLFIFISLAAVGAFYLNKKAETVNFKRYIYLKRR